MLLFMHAVCLQRSELRVREKHGGVADLPGAWRVNLTVAGHLLPLNRICYAHNHVL